MTDMTAKAAFVFVIEPTVPVVPVPGVIEVVVVVLVELPSVIVKPVPLQRCETWSRQHSLASTQKYTRAYIVRGSRPARKVSTPFTSAIRVTFEKVVDEDAKHDASPDEGDSPR